jgi:hypothetical protein
MVHAAVVDYEQVARMMLPDDDSRRLIELQRHRMLLEAHIRQLDEKLDAKSPLLIRGLRRGLPPVHHLERR